MNRLLELAIAASLEAGDLILNVYNSDDFNIKLKSDNSPLTDADILSNNKICSILGDTNIPILSEEEKEISYELRKKWKLLWVIDPIDGTKEFIKRNDEFTINIALVKNKKPIIGVIYAPALNILYFSSSEIGSYKALNPKRKISLNALIENSKKLPLLTNKNQYKVVISRSHMSVDTKKYIEKITKIHKNVVFTSIGSSLKICLVAEGSANCYPRLAPTMEWDTAAGQAICENIGISIIDYVTKRPMIYNRKNLTNNSFILKN